MKKAILLLLVALVFSNEGYGFLLHRPPRIVLQPLHATSSSINKNNNNNEKLYRELSLFMNINMTTTNTTNQSIPQHYNMPQIQQTCYDEK